MRTAIATLIVLSLGWNSVGASAQDASRRALAEELLNEMDMKGTVEKSFAMIKKMMPAQMEAMKPAKGKTDTPSIPPDATKRAAKAMDKVWDAMAQELSWDKMKDDYVTIYAETFTEEELKGAIAFYKSPAGKAFIQKQPEVMKRSMELSQRMMLKVMPGIHAMTKEMMDGQGKGVKRAPPQAKAPPPIMATPPIKATPAIKAMPPVMETQKDSK